MLAAAADHLRRGSALSRTAADHDLMGRGWLNLGRVAEAAESFHRAISLDPRFLPSHEALANLDVECGRLDEAVERLTTVATTGKVMPSAEFELAKLTDQGAADALKRIEIGSRDQPEAEGNSSIQRRVLLAHAACRRCEQLADWPSANRWLSIATSEKARSLSECVKIPFRAGQMATAYDEGFFRSLRSVEPRGGPAPILIVGMPRSGTTLLDQMIGCHDAIESAGELGALAHLYGAAKLAVGAGANHRLVAQSLTPESAHHLAIKYQSELCRHGDPTAKTRYITDKMPINFRHLGFAASILPHAKVVHLIRDPRDVFVSCLRQNLKWPFCDPNALLDYLDQYVQLMHHWRQVLPNQTLDLHYQDLVTETDSSMKILHRFLDLEPDESYANYSRRAAVVRTPSRSQVRQPLHRRGIDFWKNYQLSLGQYFEEMDRFSWS